ncbi:MAG: sigma factor, partial [Bacteroidota bacterium]
MDILLSKQVSEIIQEYAPKLRVFLRVRLSDPIITEDILQDVWYQLSKQVEREMPKNVNAWLFQVARNKVIDHYRKKAPEWLEDYLLTEEEGLSNEHWIADFYT